MKWVSKHLGLIKLLKEFRFKRWLDKNALEVLVEIGVGAGQAVLDFGCGSGTYTIPAGKLVGKDGKVYALDISKKALDRMERKAKQKDLKNIIRIAALGEGKIPIETETIDHVLLIDVLQEIDDKETLFDEIYRIIKHDGIVTVYPMHVEMREIENLAIRKGLTLKDRRFQERIPIFKKSLFP